MKKRNKLGLQILMARRMAGLSQEELAQQLNCTNRTIQIWERGDVEPSLKKISALAKVLGKDIAFFLPPDVSGDVEKIELFLPVDIAEKIRKSAKKEHLSESDFIRQILETWHEKKK